VADAIERGDFDHLQGEFGDLLFQVVYYSQLAKEEGRFEFDGVDRQHHPQADPSSSSCLSHGRSVCAARNVPRLSEEQVKHRWEEIKAEERAEKPAAPEQLSLLDDVPATLPALSRAAKLQKRAGAGRFRLARRAAGGRQGARGTRRSPGGHGRKRP
jgi:ATP diphosphatase